MINTAVQKGTSTPNTGDRFGTIYIHDFKTTVGVKSNGNPTSRIKVVLNEYNEVVTAYPY